MQLVRDKKEKADGKVKIWFRKTKNNFVDWCWSDWTIRDYFAWIGFITVFGHIISIIIGIIKSKK